MKKYAWHVFTDGRDEVYNTRKEADKLWRSWKKQGFENLRMYREIEEGDHWEENCVKSFGKFPR